MANNRNVTALDRLIDNKIVQNIVVWFFVFLVLIITVQADNRVATAFFMVLLIAPAVYVNNLLILPYLKHNVLLFILLFIVNAIVFSTISVYSITLVENVEFKLEMILNFFGALLMVLVGASAIKLARDSFTRRQENKEAELKLLKGQMNRHFLFNTLNNLYGLSVIKSDKLPNLMLKLSDLLRYSIYETGETFVSLEKEIAYLENYMALERIRLEDTTSIILNKKGDFKNLMIAPMLLIVFVENAFKHLSESDKHESRVDVSVEVKEDMLYFNCTNTSSSNSSNDQIEAGNGGIGLQNAKKRLKLLYPDEHQLKINNDFNAYQVYLKLVF